MPVTLTVTSDRVAHLTLDRPAKRNALDVAMLESLASALADIRDHSEVRVVVIRGAAGTFCAGADIADWVAPTAGDARVKSQFGIDTFAALATLPQPTLAVIEGSALGGGLELALACDLRVAADDALLGLPELTLGNLPAWGGTARLVDVAGLGVARQLLLTGELIRGSRAAELGIVGACHTPEQLNGAVDDLISRLLGVEPTAVGLTKSLLARLESTVTGEALTAAYTAGLDSSRDRKQAFLDRKNAGRQAPTAPTTPDQKD